jgi:hypothetical protein
MAKSSKQEKKRIHVRMPIFSDESLSDAVEDAAYPDTGKSASPVSVYGQLLGERNRYIDARHVAQQRIDQIVAGAAAAALVLSITFMIGAAPSPAAKTAWLLGASWVALAVALGASLAHHYLAQRALDDYVRELDRAFGVRDLPAPRGVAAALPLAASVALVVGVASMAVFAFMNLAFA